MRAKNESRARCDGNQNVNAPDPCPFTPAGLVENAESLRSREARVSISPMNCFVIHAHPEPQSFNGALFRTATDKLAADGHAM